MPFWTTSHDRESTNLTHILDTLHWNEDTDGTREARYDHLMRQHTVDRAELARLAWSGVAEQYRPRVWGTLLSYYPSDQSAVQTVVHRRRWQYRQILSELFDSNGAFMGFPRASATVSRMQQILGLSEEVTTHRGGSSLIAQVEMDTHRTFPGVALARAEFAQRTMRRVLICWSALSPCGYVQGVGDLVFPFLVVHACSKLNNAPSAEPHAVRSQREFIELEAHTIDTDTAQLDDVARLNIEADTFWCVSGFLCTARFLIAQDHSAVQKELRRMDRIVQHVNFPLHTLLRDCGVGIADFAFRWVRCLLARELPLMCCIRLWDTYIGEGTRFVQLHTFVCAALLCSFADTLCAMKSAEEILLFLKALPRAQMSMGWTETLIRQSFIHREMFGAKVKGGFR